MRGSRLIFFGFILLLTNLSLLSSQSGALVPYKGPVEHIFFHPLIAFPEKAFSSSIPEAERAYIDDWFVTVEEFRLILDELYARNYVLVDIHDAFDLAGLCAKELFLPPGKIPLIISVDDLNYYGMMIRRGTNSYLMVEKSGRLVSVGLDAKGRQIISDDREIVTILERFIADKPDFSLGGARGIIGLTGYRGLFGWYMAEPERSGYATQLAGARAVATKLTSMGWRFASHSWSHKLPKQLSDAEFYREEGLWAEIVGPVLGATKLYIYPFGANLDAYPQRLDWLSKRGFSLFFGADARQFIVKKNGILSLGRTPIDGKTLRLKAHYAKKFLDFQRLQARPRQL